MDAFLRPLAPCRFYPAIIRQKRKDFGEIENIEKYSQKNVFVCVCAYIYLRIVVHGRICDC